MIKKCIYSYYRGYKICELVEKDKYLIFKHKDSYDILKDNLNSKYECEEFIDEYIENEYCKGYMKQIRSKLIKLGLDKDYVSLFNDNQLRELDNDRIGKDVIRVAKFEYTEDQMYWLIEGLKNSRDISLMENPKFTVGQMELIYEGLIERIEVELYAKTYYSSYRMSILKQALVWNKEYNYDLTPLFNVSFSDKQIQFLSLKIRGGIDKDTLKKINNPNLSLEDMKEVLDNIVRKKEERERKQHYEEMTKEKYVPRCDICYIEHIYCESDYYDLYWN